MLHRRDKPQKSWLFPLSAGSLLPTQCCKGCCHAVPCASKATCTWKTAVQGTFRPRFCTHAQELNAGAHLDVSDSQAPAAKSDLHGMMCFVRLNIPRLGKTVLLMSASEMPN